MSIKVLKVAPKDLYVTFEISFEDLRKVVTALDLAKVEYDGTKPEEALAAMYLEKELFPLFNQVVNDLEEDMRRGS